MGLKDKRGENVKINSLFFFFNSVDPSSIQIYFSGNPRNVHNISLKGEGRQKREKEGEG